MCVCVCASVLHEYSYKNKWYALKVKSAEVVYVSEVCEWNTDFGRDFTATLNAQD